MTDPTMAEFKRLLDEFEGASITRKHYDAARAAVLEHVRGMLEQRWQPISTAPKDCDVWLYSPRQEPAQFVGYYVNAHGGYWAYREALVEDVTGGMEAGSPNYPTHWQPLPPPPVRKEQDDARHLARDALAAAATPAPQADDESDMLTIAYMSGFHAGKKAAPQAEDARDAVFNEFAEFVTVHNKEQSVPWPLAELFVRHYRAAIRAAMKE